MKNQTALFCRELHAELAAPQRCWARGHPPCSWVLPAPSLALAHETPAQPGTAAGMQMLLLRERGYQPQKRTFPLTLSSLLNSRERKRKTESSSIHGTAERGRKIKSSAQQTSYIAALLNQLFPPQSCSRISEFTQIDNQHLKITTSKKARGLYTSRVLPVLGIRPILKNATTLHLFA